MSGKSTALLLVAGALGCNALDNNGAPASRMVSLEASDSVEPAADGALAPAGYPSFTQTLWQDYRRFYSPETLLGTGLGLATAAVLANTSLDGDFRDWYQGSVRSEGSDDFAHIVKPIGNWKYATPLYAALTIVRRTRADIDDAGPLEEWGERCLRAIAVGGPATLVLQVFTGAGRPVEGPSTWDPFDDNNGVSGHAFIGAVPFLAAARMAESKGWKTVFFLGSFLCGWSRINDDMHYLSQVGMGWWTAYLATGSVEATESAVFLVPGGVGIALQF